MQEKTLFKTAIIVAVIGLSFLFIYTEKFDLEAVGSSDSVDVGKEIHLKGKINRLTATEKATFLELEGEEIVNTDVILFPEEKVNLREGDYVEIYGKVEEYNSQKEVVGSKVVLK